jgi:hypothetical protein
MLGTSFDMLDEFALKPSIFVDEFAQRIDERDRTWRAVKHLDTATQQVRVA